MNRPFKVKDSPIHAKTSAMHAYYIHSLSDIQSKEKLYKTDDNGDTVEYSYLFKQTEYSQILKSLNLNIIDQLLHGKTMPLGRVGFLRIVATRRVFNVDDKGKLIKKNMGVDWKKTRELWAKIYPEVVVEKQNGNMIFCYKHIEKKPLVYYDNKYEIKLALENNRKRNRPTGLQYYQIKTSDTFKKLIRKAIGDTEGLHVAAEIYENREYKNNAMNEFTRRIHKLN